MFPFETEPKSITIQGEISVEDVALACSLHRRSGGMWKIMAVLVAILIAMVFVDVISHGGLPRDLTKLLKLGAVALGLLAFAFVFPRDWLPHETAGYEVMRVVTGEGIYVQDGSERAFCAWEHIVRGKTSANMGILYTSRPPGAYILPRRMFSSNEDWTRFRELVQANTL